MAEQGRAEQAGASGGTEDAGKQDTTSSQSSTSPSLFASWTSAFTKSNRPTLTTSSGSLTGLLARAARPASSNVAASSSSARAAADTAGSGETAGEGKCSSKAGALAPAAASPGGSKVTSMLSAWTTRLKSSITESRTEFLAEKRLAEAAAGPACRAVGDDTLPWESIPAATAEQREQVRQAVLQLSADVKTFTVDAPPGDMDGFDLQQHLALAQRLLQADPRLEARRCALAVRVSEQRFWRNYFWQVGLVKQAVVLAGVNQAQRSGISAEAGDASASLLPRTLSAEAQDPVYRRFQQLGTRSRDPCADVDGDDADDAEAVAHAEDDEWASEHAIAVSAADVAELDLLGIRSAEDDGGVAPRADTPVKPVPPTPFSTPSKPVPPTPFSTPAKPVVSSSSSSLGVDVDGELASLTQQSLSTTLSAADLAQLDKELEDLDLDDL